MAEVADTIRHLNVEVLARLRETGDGWVEVLTVHGPEWADESTIRKAER